MGIAIKTVRPVERIGGRKRDALRESIEHVLNQLNSERYGVPEGFYGIHWIRFVRKSQPK
ncbi:MAG TPA: hypothetical protein VM577_05415 [Anaerovoracaceae bacterium]|nr:hypothetical protein [Anaerovoracaceae bacterium]